MGVNLGGEKGEELRWARDSARACSLELLQDSTQPRERRTQAVADISFSWEEQRHTVNIPTGVALGAEGELSDLGRDEARMCGHSCLAKGISD